MAASDSLRVPALVPSSGSLASIAALAERTSRGAARPQAGAGACRPCRHPRPRAARAYSRECLFLSSLREPGVGRGDGVDRRPPCPPVDGVSGQQQWHYWRRGRAPSVGESARPRRVRRATAEGRPDRAGARPAGTARDRWHARGSLLSPPPLSRVPDASTRARRAGAPSRPRGLREGMRATCFRRRTGGRPPAAARKPARRTGPVQGGVQKRRR
jgi:hypothetical protein